MFNSSVTKDIRIKQLLTQSYLVRNYIYAIYAVNKNLAHDISDVTL